MPDSIGITQSTIPPGVIDLGLGHPGDDLLPLAILQQAAQHRHSAGDPSFLQYGLEQGNPFLREALARFLSDAYSESVDSQSLLITNGVSQALDLICTLYTQPGDAIAVEEPTYFLALRIFADHGLRVVPIPVDDHGLRLEDAQRVLSEQRPRLIYTIPTHQNPSGRTLADERRQALVDLALRHEVRVVAHEVYHLLTYNGAPPRPLAAWSDQPHVIALGSFSKILAPGLRLGWMQAAPETISRIVGCGLLDSGGGLNPFTSAVVQSVLDLNLLQGYVERLCATYSRRRDALAAALDRHLGQRVQFTTPVGGYFLWVDLGSDVDAEALLSTAISQGVSYRPGARFSSERAFRSHVRLSYSYYVEADLEEAVRRLAKVLR
jgi:DNA-binding transcriptional MocR family regulator